MEHNFYIGTCRYESFFYNKFPPRLHTTKEILNYLVNYNNIDLNSNFVNFIYGGCLHPQIIDIVKKYLKDSNNIFDNIDTIYIEISSLKNYLIDDKYLNAFYVEDYNIDKNNMKQIELSYDDIYNDLVKIKDLCINKFKIKRIKIITHVNLKLKKTNNYILQRDKLINYLLSICKKLEIDIILPDKILLSKYNDIFLEDVLYDGLHYSNIEYPKYIINNSL